MKKIYTLQSDEGKGIYFSWQKTVGNYIAVNKSDNNVIIYNRHCEKIQSFSLTGIISGFGWDEAGDTFAIINNKSSNIQIWNANTFKSQMLESGFKDTDLLTFIQWSKKGSLLAIGTSKGNLLIYNHQTNRKIPMIGKHTKSITTGAWSRENVLALAGDDKMLSMSEANGDGIGQVQIGGKLTNLQFGEMKTNSRMGIENTVSGIKDHKTLMFIRMEDVNHPLLIQFRNEYGDIVSYTWYGDGYLMIGFSNGYFLVISTHNEEISTEIYLVKDYNNGLQCLAISNSLNVVATSGDGCIKMHDLADWKRISNILFLDDEQKTKLDRMQWTDNGQLLAVATLNGQLSVFLTKLPMLGCTHGTNVAYLTSLLEVTLINPIKQQTSITLKIETEPSFISLSQSYLVTGLNSRAWFYNISDNCPAGGKQMREKEYPGSVQIIKINCLYAAAAMDGKILLHLIDDTDDVNGFNDKSSKMFLDGKYSDHKITSHELIQDFLIFSTDKGLIRYFSLEDFEYSTEFLHSSGVKKIFADPSGSRLIFIDEKNEGYVYNPINDMIIPIQSMSPKTLGAVWDKKEKSTDCDSALIPLLCVHG